MAFCGEKNQKLLFKVDSLLNFRKWFMYGLKAQKLLAQGNVKRAVRCCSTPCFTLIEQALSAFFNVNYV